MSFTETVLAPTSAELAELTRFTPRGQRIAADLPIAAGPEFIAAMIEKRLFKDANRAIPYFMTNRKACWWASLCIWRSLEGKLSTDEQRALDGCLRWIIDPSLEHRRSAGELADATSAASPVNCLGAAIRVADCLPPGATGFPAAKPRLAARLCFMATLACYFAGGRRPKHREEFALIGAEILHERQLWMLSPSAAADSHLSRYAVQGAS